MILPMLFAHSLYKAIRMRKPFYWKQHCLLFDQNHNGKEIRHLGIGLGSLYSEETSVTQIDMFQEPVEDTNDVAMVLKQ